MQYHTAHGDGMVQVTLNGRVTYADHAAFRTIVALIRDADASEAVFDLGQVEFIDSAGLGMLLMARDAAIQKKAEVVLRGATGQVERLFSASKFDTLFTLQP